MHQTSITLILCLILSIKMAGASSLNNQESLETRFGRLVNRFGLSFMNKLEGEKENVIYSPLSIVLVLNMLYLGTDKQSKEGRELSKILGYEDFCLSCDLDLHKAADKTIMSMLDAVAQNVKDEQNADLNFTMSNLVLTSHKAGDLAESFEDAAGMYYQAKLAQFRLVDGGSQPIAPVDILTRQVGKIKFNARSPKDVAEAVNYWVKENTNGRIDNLVEPDVISADRTSAILANAIFFKASWKDAFPEYRSKENFFHNEGNKDKQVKVPFMSQRGTYKYYDSSGKRDNSLIDIDLKMVEIPFSADHGEEFSMVIIMPENTAEIVKLERWLTVENLQSLYGKLNYDKVDLSVPKFSFDKLYEASDILKKMGIHSIFSSGSGLTKMFKSPIDQRVDKVIHKAKISVDEKGAEASAATVLTFKMVSLDRDEAEIFHVDHPFLMTIRHKKSNMSLFMGKLYYL